MLQAPAIRILLGAIERLQADLESLDTPPTEHQRGYMAGATYILRALLGEEDDEPPAAA